MELQDNIIINQLKSHIECTTLAPAGTEGWCPAEFDGITCWPPAQAGNVSVQTCPVFPHATVNRLCSDEGIWESENNISYASCGLDSGAISTMRQLYGYIRAKGSTVPAKWYFYHRHAECLDRMNNSQLIPGVCPMLFDGWSCWDHTAAGDTAYTKCPKHIIGFDPARYAFRTCTENGTWFLHPETGRPWSNYTTCVDIEDLAFRQVVNNIYITGYSLSFLTLLISLFIFVYFRSLKCIRIRIHIHLFLSFAFNNLVWIIWYTFVVGDLENVEKNQIWCQALHVFLQYLMVANYAWMFCEGMHLHLALVVVFVKEDVVMRSFYFVGWVLPALLAAIYALVRANTSEETDRCWIEESHCDWILTAPVLLSLFANVVFLVNVLRVILTKLHPGSSSPAPRGMRKAVRATLILIPLFGLHHILLPFRPEPRTTGESVYQVFSACIVSLQGFCVSCLFCFANVDVHVALRNVLRRIRRTTGAMHANTQTREACGAL